MPTITLKISDEQRELWVEAAEKEGCSLSEWLRRAAMTRSGGVDGMRIEEGQVVEEETLFGVGPQMLPPQSERVFRGPDFKAGKEKKTR